MDSASAKIQIQAWTSVGLMKPKSVLERLDERIKDYGGLSEEERDGLKRNFNLACNNQSGFTEDVFTSFVRNKLQLSADFTEALRIIFHSLGYLRRSPFQFGSLKGEALTFNELVRSLAWMLPQRQERFLEASDFCRARTPADHRRIIFQSLATSLRGKDLPLDREPAQELAYRNAPTFEKESMMGPREMGFDDDGDETYHDLLDVLYSSQPTISPAYAPARQEDFRSIAKTLHGSAACLYERTIPKARFESLLKLLIAKHLDLESPQASPELEAAARCVANAFCHNAEVDGITWLTFDFAIVKLAPQLLEPLYHILSVSLLDRYCGEITDPSTPPLSPGKVLSLPRLGQLSTILSESIYFGDLQCHHSWCASKPTIPELMSEITKIPESAVLVISGSTSTGDSCIFGSFIASPSKDGMHITERERGYWEKTLLFQLSPIHDVFRGASGKAAWEISDEGVLFGDGNSGASLRLGVEMNRAIFLHKLSTASKEREQVYQPTEWRGTWELEIEIGGIELWGEVSS